MKTTTSIAILLLLPLLFLVAPCAAAPPVADSGATLAVTKNRPLGAVIEADGSASTDPDNDALRYEWFGPLARAAGERVSLEVPEGTHWLSLAVEDATARSTSSVEVTVTECLHIEARAKGDKVQLTWTPLAGTERYDIFRADGVDPVLFTKVGETTSTFALFGDAPVSTGTTHLYVVGALVNGAICYSNAVGSHALQHRDRSANQPPVIGSAPIVQGYQGIPYSYDITAVDPNSNPETLIHTLTVAPEGMVIDQTSGLISWTPASAGPVAVTVVVSDGAAGVDQSFTITVAEAPPLITAHPLDLQADFGAPAYFAVTTTGSNLSYQWQRNGEDIPAANESTYMLDAVTDADNGALFQCRVSNASGSRTSLSATLTVAAQPPAISQQPLPLSVNEGEEATFSLLAAGPALTYQWFKDNEAISGASASTLTLPGVQYTDNGARIHCLVGNEAGVVASDPAVLTVTDLTPPQLLIDGPLTRSTTNAFVEIRGTVGDTGVGPERVEILSNRLDGQIFEAKADPLGGFTVEALLRGGENILTVIASDRGGLTTRATVTVTMELPTVPEIIISSPANGAMVTGDRVTMSGLVRSTLSGNEIKLLCNGQVLFLSGSGGEYPFSFTNLPLSEGSNTLSVDAETIHGNARATTTIRYLSKLPEEQVVLPEIAILSTPGGDLYQSGDTIVISGTAGSAAGIQGITVNGQPVTMTGSGASVSFDHELLFSELGADEVEIVVVVIDANGKASTLTYLVHHDSTPPQIHFDPPLLLPAPAINSVLQTPYPLSGTVVEQNLAGLSINGQVVEVQPTGAGHEWSFAATLDLKAGVEQQLAILAWDMAGNQVEHNLALRLDSSLEIEVISPTANTELTVSGQSHDLEVVARVPGMAADDQIRFTIDSGAEVMPQRSGAVARADIAMPATDGRHTLLLEVSNPAGMVLARRSVSFSLINEASIPLSVIRQEPARDESGVEANRFISFYFNKAIDPARLQVEVRETAHGLIYADAQEGEELSAMNTIELVEVHRDREVVNGGLSYFAESMMAAFYPERDFAYQGEVFVTITYDGQELSRSNFTIRPLPTIIQGFVANQFMQPLKGVTVGIAKLGLSAVTDTNGTYGFGMGAPATAEIPAGRYLAVANPGMKDRAHGSVEFWVDVEQGRLNTVAMTKLPVISPEIPFARLHGGQNPAVLAGGDLLLDLSGADLVFADGKGAGDVHPQFTGMEAIPYPSPAWAMPYWVYVMQPSGIKVSGAPGVTLAMPPLAGGHAYVSQIGKHVLLLGLDPASLTIVPVGVGLVEVENKRVVSVGAVALQRLDVLGYAIVEPEKQEILARFAAGAITLPMLIGELN